MPFSQGRGGAGEGWGTQVSITQMTPAEPPKVYRVTSGHLLDSSRECEECSNIPLVPKEKEAETEVNRMEHAPNISKGHTDRCEWDVSF